jgi:hypothetical protein
VLALASSQNNGVFGGDVVVARQDEQNNQLDIGISSDSENRKTRGAKQTSLMLVYFGAII